MNATVVPDQFQSIGDGRRGRSGRRLVVGCLAAFLFLGVLGIWGTRQNHRSVRAAGYEVQLSHPGVTRGGLPSSWAIDIQRLDGSSLPAVEISTTTAYFDIFDHNELVPTPDSDTRQVMFAPGNTFLRTTIDCTSNWTCARNRMPVGSTTRPPPS